MGYQLTYDGLVTELKRIVDNDAPDFVAELPAIVSRAHDHVQRDLDLAMWRTFENNHVSVGDPYYPRNPAWLVIHSIWFPAKGVDAQKRTLDYVRRYGVMKGVPRIWCERDETRLQLAPIPDNNYEVEIEVVTRIAFDAANQTTWISQNAADLLLLIALVYCESFLVGSERMNEFALLYAAALKAAKHELRSAARSEYGPVRSAARPSIKHTTEKDAA